MSYIMNGDNATRIAPIRHTTGRSLAQVRNHLSKTECAFLGADIIAGRVVIDNLTIGQIAALVGVNRNYVALALKASTAERYAIEHGWRPLLPPAKPLALPAPALGLIGSWAQATVEERREFARMRGEQVLDHV